MPKNKINDKTVKPTNIANLSQNQDKQLNMPAGKKSSAGQGAGQGSK